MTYTTENNYPHCGKLSSALVLAIFALCLFQESVQGFARGFAPPTAKPNTSTATIHRRAKEEQFSSLFDSSTKPKIQREKNMFLLENMDSSEDFLKFLKGSNNDKPTVVYYHAPWCKRCQKVGMLFNKVANQLGGGNGRRNGRSNFRFGTMECTSETKDFLKDTMQIRGLPSLRVYQGNDLLYDAGSCPRDLAQQLSLFEHENLSKATEAAAVAWEEEHERLQLSLGVATL